MLFHSGEREEHKKEKVKLTVFYINARSINPTNTNGNKCKFLKDELNKIKPDVVAIVETWLTNKISVEQVEQSLGLADYVIFRRDRTDQFDGQFRKGGGVLIAVKSTSNLLSKETKNYNGEFIALLLTYKFNCEACAGKKSSEFSFGLVYRRTTKFKNEEKTEFEITSNNLWTQIYSFCSEDLEKPEKTSVLIGDFNFGSVAKARNIVDKNIVNKKIYREFKKHVSKIFEKGLYADKEEINSNILSSFGSGSNFVQRVEEPTHVKGGILDLIFSLPENFVSNIKNCGYIPKKQDHCILTFDMNIGYDCNNHKY